MNHERQHIASFLAAFIAVAIPAFCVAAETRVLAQDLVKVRASPSVAAALWTRRSDSYTLQIVLPFTGCGVPRANVVAAPDAPQNERASFFTGNTIANLRGLDPTNGGCTLTLIDGRRNAAGSSQPASSRPAEQTASQKTVVAFPKDPPSIQVWLLRADGTQIPPLAVAMETSNAYGCRTNCPVSGKQYRFPLGESAQAVAVAIQVDNDYYIEKLQSLESNTAVQ